MQFRNQVPLIKDYDRAARFCENMTLQYLVFLQHIVICKNTGIYSIPGDLNSYIWKE